MVRNNILLIYLISIFVSINLFANDVENELIDLSNYYILKQFAEENFFNFTINKTKQIIVLKKNSINIKIIPDYQLALINNQVLLHLKNEVVFHQGNVYIHRDFAVQISNYVTKNNASETSVPAKMAEVKSPSDKISYQDTGNLKYIFIDPGHGGKDPGAVNKNISVYEKDLNLAIAKKLQYILERKFEGLKIVNLRSDDKYLSLEERTNIINKLTDANNYGILISIHANSSLKKDVYGVETFYFNPEENKRSKKINSYRMKLFKDNIAKQYTKDEKNKLIISNSINKTITNYSLDLAGKIQENIIKLIGKYTASRGIKRANFQIISYVQIPAILCEVGFMSNDIEGKNLMNNDYQWAIALGMAKGLMQFINHNKDNFCFYGD